MKKSIWLGCALFCFAGLKLAAQQVVPGEAIVMFWPGFGPVDLLSQRANFRHKQVLSEDLRIHLFTFDTLNVPPSEAPAQLRRMRGVALAQLNHIISLRRPFLIPNDPQFGQQWALNNTGQAGGSPGADIQAVAAWDLQTGGVNPLGDSIVAAVIDGGMDLLHPETPLWKNRREIPGNGIDDDGNGYIDDFDGWNAFQGNGVVPSDLHGTHVTGIVSARGNNGVGFAGVSWHTLVMPIAGASGSEAVAVAAYAYALKQRRIFNRSGGRFGAFVVATNSSFGVDFGKPDQFPIWCALYDSLGAEGILNPGATMNINADVDVAGDIPTACPSDFMIGVTNTTRRDQRNTSAAYGLLSVDLGAPGTDILSAVPGGGAGFLTGTSMATPHVTGVLALMYAHACPLLSWKARTAPAATALLMRDLLFQSVDTLPGLELETTTGGRLNARKALEAVDAWCEAQPPQCLPPFSPQVLFAGNDSISLQWTLPAGALGAIARIRPAGGGAWLAFSTDSSLYLGGLNRCAPYELSLATVCTPGDTSFFSPPWPFETNGCCRPPQRVEVLTTTDSAFLLSWEPSAGADTFRIQIIRRADGNLIAHLAVTDTFLWVNGLSPCEGYEARLFSQCDSLASAAFTPVLTPTRGCGPCEAEAYCESVAAFSTDEWVERVEIGPFARLSGNDGGYAAAFFPKVSLLSDTVYPVRLTPAYAGFAFSENWQIWIDLNGDTLFSDNERLFVSSAPTAGEVTGMLRLPAVTDTLRTRMRVVMSFAGFGAAPKPGPCDSFSFGEVEDYCLELIPHTSPCLPPSAFSVAPVPDSQGTRVRWTPYFKSDGYLVSVRVNNGPWSFVKTNLDRFLVTGLKPCIPVDWRVASLCGADTSRYSDTLTVWSFGCGPCLDKTYCESGGESGAWIASMDWNGTELITGPDAGYFFHSAGMPIDWELGVPIPFLLRGASPGPWAGAYWRIWADLNGDGDFNDPDELVFDPGLVQADSVEGELTLSSVSPFSPDLLRMRVSMRRGEAPDPCGVFADGETEDICLAPARPQSVAASPPDPFWVIPNPFDQTLQIGFENPPVSAQIRLYNVQGSLIYSAPWQAQAFPTQHLPPGLYLLEVTLPSGNLWRRVLKP